MENLELIDGANEMNRLKHLLSCVPDVFNYKTVLYVGGGNRLQMFDQFVKNGCIIDVVEVWQPNVLKLAKVEGIRTVHHSDIEVFNPTDKYDVVFFWHGLEHIRKEKVTQLFKKFDSYVNYLIVLGMPYGNYPQGTLYDNPFENHVSSWYPEDFKYRKWNCDTIGKRDTKRANLVAWKRYRR